MPKKSATTSSPGARSSLPSLTCSPPAVPETKTRGFKSQQTSGGSTASDHPRILSRQDQGAWRRPRGTAGVNCLAISSCQSTVRPVNISKYCSKHSQKFPGHRCIYGHLSFVERNVRRWLQGTNAMLNTWLRQQVLSNPETSRGPKPVQKQFCCQFCHQFRQLQIGEKQGNFLHVSVKRLKGLLISKQFCKVCHWKSYKILLPRRTHKQTTSNSSHPSSYQFSSCLHEFLLKKER